MPDLTEATLLHLAPHAGTSGVGDHADDFVAAVAPYVGEVVELRHGPPRGDSIRDVLRFRRRVRDAVRERQGRTVIVHSELSGGAIAPLWACAGLKGARRSATFHDAPRPVWYPYLTRGLSRIRLMSYAVHRPLSWLTIRLERRLMRNVDLFALSEEGVESMQRLRMGRSQHVSHLLVAERPAIPPAGDRPRAVGLFGHVYTGKGFEKLRQLRAALDDDIALLVAGRGTESLPAVDGVEVLGAVEGSAEDEFFASIRVLLLPYDRRYVYGMEAFPASSVLMRAVSYVTPSVSLAVTNLVSAAAAGATIAVEGDATALARAATALVGDPAAMDRAVKDLQAFADTQTADSAIQPFLQVWSA